jgi:hypothetical protein
MYDSRGLPVSKQGSMMQNSLIKSGLRSKTNGGDDSEDDDPNGVSAMLSKNHGSSLKQLDLG